MSDELTGNETTRNSITMSESAPSDAPEPHPFQKFTEFARKIIAVPKAEADKKYRLQKGNENVGGCGL